MSDERVGNLVKQHLNESLEQIPEDITSRLANARMVALAHQKQPAQVYSFAGAVGNFFNSETRHFKHLLAGLLILAGTSMYVYNESDRFIQETIDVDTALLTDEIPIGAYMDRDFMTWLEERGSDNDNNLQ